MAFAPERRHALLAELSSNPQYTTWEIEDVWPCTPMQEGLVALTSRGTKAPLRHVVLDLNPEVDADRLRKAVQMVVDRAAVLRTKIVCPQAAELVQVVAKSDIQWRHRHDLEAYLAEVKDLPWALGGH